MLDKDPAFFQGSFEKDKLQDKDKDPLNCWLDLQLVPFSSLASSPP